MKTKDLAADRYAIMQALKLSVTAEFVPQSKSRNAKEKTLSLNWMVTVKVGDRKVITTDYMQGIGHLPWPKGLDGRSITGGAYQKLAVEAGKIPFVTSGGNVTITHLSRPITPPTRDDVIYSLLMDAEVIDYSSFEEWADATGYSSDSRQAEKTYRACLEIALKLRAGIGDENLVKLREAFQDY